MRSAKVLRADLERREILNVDLFPVKMLKIFQWVCFNFFFPSFKNFRGFSTIVGIKAAQSLFF